jgi:hypothetical protein
MKYYPLLSCFPAYRAIRKGTYPETIITMHVFKKNPLPITLLL